ncbi:hypothetical protein [Candidatus Nitrospira bockiana]
MSTGLMRVVNLPEFVEGIAEGHKLQLSFQRGELKRGGKRVRRQFIRESLSGRPGIKGGAFKKGKQIFSFVKGASASDLAVHVGISRAIRVHEEGYTFKPLHGDRLYIRAAAKGGGKGEIVATAAQVTIPKRTRFRAVAKELAPAILEKTAQAGLRAYDVAITKHLKQSVGL